MKKIALYGGTFDPIHRAHVALADYAVKELNLAALYFMPNYVNPFKQEKKVSPGEDRLEMVRRILPYNPAFQVSDYEIKHDGPSYTYDTLMYLKEHLDGELHFLLGFDTIVELDTWYRGVDILSNIPLITSARPGTDYEQARLKIIELEKKYNAVIYILSMPPMDISATMIREKANKGESIIEYVHPEVEEYILEHQLYK